MSVIAIEIAPEVATDFEPNVADIDAVFMLAIRGQRDADYARGADEIG